MLVNKVSAQEVLDSRGNPTLDGCVVLEDGTSASAIGPSGASTGDGGAMVLVVRTVSQRFA